MKKNIVRSLASLVLFISFMAQGQHPQYDATYLSVVKEYTLHPDGATEYRYQKVQKLNTYRAFHNLYGETFVIYNPDFQKLKINEAYTIMADGKKVITPENAFNEVLPGFASGAPDFNMLREMVITHTGLEKNATVHLDYSIVSQKGFMPFLTGDELLADVETLKELIIKVKVPVGTPLNHKLLNMKGKPGISSEGNYTVYTWKFTDLPVISAEENQAGASAGYPHLQFSTVKTYNVLIQELTKQDAFAAKVSDEMIRETESLSTENPDKLMFALKLQEKIVNEINLVNTPMIFTGYRVRTPGQVWMSNYGRGIEKALLLTGILKHYGIQARTVAVARPALLEPTVPVTQVMEDILVEMTLPGSQPLYLSVTTLQQPVTNGRALISLEHSSAGEIISLPDAQSSVASKFVLFLSPEFKLTGTGNLVFENGFNPYLSLVKDQAKVKNYLSGGIRSADIKDVKDVNLTAGRTTFECTLQKDKPLRKDTSLYFYTLPVLTNGVDSWGIKSLPSGRKTTFEIPSAASETVDVTLTLPGNLVLFTPEGRSEIKNAAGSYLFEISQDAGKIIIHKELRINSRRISPSEYLAFKTLMDNWNLPSSREIVFVGK